MKAQGRRHLPGGREVPIHDNDGLRKICPCPRRSWPKCSHAWHFAFCWKRRHYRFSLDRHVGKHIASKTEAKQLADQFRSQVRAGTFRASAPPSSAQPSGCDPGSLSFAALADLFVDHYSKAREKASWDDDASMLRQVMAFPITWPGVTRLGDKPLRAVNQDDLEAFIRHVAATRTIATRNHYVQLIRTFSSWAVKRGYRQQAFATSESEVIRRKKAAKRNRRLEPGEEDRLLAAANPYLQRLIIAALETCCRQGELLSLQWQDVSFGRGEIVLRAHKTKTATDRIIPMSSRLRAVLDLVRLDPNGKPHGPAAYVFGDELGHRVKCVGRAWRTAVLKAHGHTPMWAWRRGGSKKGTGKLGPASLEQLRAINLHFHDLRHEAGSRLLEAGWPLHEVQQMLGHASLEQTSTYLNATLRGMHRSMRAFDRTRFGAKAGGEEGGSETVPPGEADRASGADATAAETVSHDDVEPSIDKSSVH